MASIQRILLPVDFSELSEHAAVHARLLAEACGATVDVVHVFSPTSSSSGEGMVALPLSGERMKRMLDEFVRAHFTGMESRVRTNVTMGSPVEAITVYAREKDMDLIVLGTHARGVVNRIFTGSVSKSVMENAPCPVLMVPLAAKTPAAV